METGQVFQSKADVYASARPPWQDEDVNILLRKTGFDASDLSGTVVVDVGAGGGFLTEHFLERGATVIAVEPNAAMRTKMSEQLGARSNLIITDGNAADLKIPQGYLGKADLIISGNAQHWWGKHAPDNTDPEVDAKIAQSWATVAKPTAKVAIAFNKMEEKATEVVRLQDIGMQYFSKKMDSPFAPAKREPFEAGQFQEYFDGDPQEYHRMYNMAFADLENFQQWLVSHSYISDDAFESPETASELKALYEGLPENNDNKKLWPYQVSLYTGDLNRVPDLG